MSEAPQNCTRCPALVTHRSRVVNGRGVGTRVLFVGQNPGEMEDELGKCFIGRSGQVLGALVNLAGILMEDARFTNAVRCWSPGNRAPKKDEILSCQPYLQEEIMETRPDLIVTLGAVALQSLYEKVPLGTVVGQTLYYHEDTLESGAVPTPLLPTYHPAAIMRNWALAPLVMTHLEKAKRLLDGTQKEEPLGNYTVLKTLDDLDAATPDLLNPPQGFLSIDSETAGLEWKEDEIMMVSFSTSPGNGYAIPILGQHIKSFGFWQGLYPQLIAKVGEILSSDTPKALQNGSFDIRFLERSSDQPWVKAATSFGWRVANLKHDTMLLHKALHEEMPKETKPNEQSRLLSLYTGMPDYWAEGRKKSKNKSQVYLLEDEMLWEDGAADADGVSRLVPIFRPELESEGMGWVMDNITIPMIRACQNMTVRGILIDREYFDRLCAYYDGKVKECEKELFAIAGDFNPNSTRQVQEVLFKKLGLPRIGRKTDAARECTLCLEGSPCDKHDSTDAAALGELYDRTQHPFLEAFIRYRSLTKIKSTYLDGSAKKLEEGQLGGFARHIMEDGRLHPEVKVGGAETGRLSMANPAAQTPPKDVVIEEWGEKKAFRRAFIASEGHVLMEADWSQLEVWANSYLSDDEDFLQLLLNGIDVHTHVARQINWPDLARLGHPFPVDPELNDTEWQEQHDDLRRRGKDMVFGVQFGLTVEGVVERMNCSEEEAKRVLDLYFELRPKLKDFLDQRREQILRGEPIITPFERRFIFPQIPILQAAQQNTSRGMWRMCQNEIEAAIREGSNRDTQSSGSDLHSLAHLWTEHTPILEGRLRPNLAVHDSVIGEAHAPGQEFIIETAWKIKEHWQKIATDTVLPSGDLLGWEIPVDVSWGPDWGNLTMGKITPKGDLITAEGKVA